MADHFGAAYVPEMARTYLQQLDRPYSAADVLKIAQQQRTEELRLAKTAGNMLICDTDLRVCRIWMEFKYGEVSPWISDEIKKQSRLLYLLCDIDLPWTFDPMREHPNHRQELFDLYKTDLLRDGCNFVVVSGQGNDRFKMAVQLIEQQLKMPQL